MAIRFNKSKRWKIAVDLFAKGNFDLITIVNGQKHEKQEEAFKYLTDHLTTELCYGGAARGGKSWTGCVWLMFSCLAYPGIRCFVGRIDVTELKESTLVTFQKVALRYGIIEGEDFKYNSNDHVLNFANGSTIKLLALRYEPSDPDYNKLGSTEYTMGWLEEAPEAEVRVYDVLKVRVGEHLNDKYNLKRKLFITCNPNKKWIYQLFYLPDKNKTLPEGKVFLKALAKNNPHNQKDTEQKLNELKGVDGERFRDGNWEYVNDTRCLVTSEEIDYIFNNHYLLDRDYEYKHISADLAMQGRDSFVAGVWRGMVCKVEIDKPTSSGKSIQQDLERLMLREDISPDKLIADSDGLGQYLSSYIEGMVSFHGNASANNREFANKKSENAYKLAEVIKKRELYVICTQEQRIRITEELGVLMARDFDADETKKKIIKKEEMKSILGRSPDYLDMLIMGMDFQTSDWDTGVYY